MQVRWLTFGADVNPITRYNPRRPAIHWYNSRRMNSYVSKEIDQRVAKLQSENNGSGKGNRSIIDLVLTTSMSKSTTTKPDAMDSTFKKFTMSQIKLFLFSGHDTTSSTVCWLFYILATHPAVLARVRAEHASILTPHISHTASVLKSNPHLLNQLPYTLAVLKETLRLYPPVSSTRAGTPSQHITDAHGRHFPTHRFLVWANPQPIHRDPAYWPDPDAFLPARWLVPQEHPLYPVQGAWRPFEHGPRNCIGQELAMLELKVIVVMAVRRFEVRLAYPEWDRVNGTKGVTTVYGERGYQVERAQPCADLPCRVAEVVA